MEPMFASRIMVRPAIRCSRCIPKPDTKQRAAATIGAMLPRQVASKHLHPIKASTQLPHPQLKQINIPIYMLYFIGI